MNTVPTPSLVGLNRPRSPIRRTTPLREPGNPRRISRGARIRNKAGGQGLRSSPPPQNAHNRCASPQGVGGEPVGHGAHRGTHSRGPTRTPESRGKGGSPTHERGERGQPPTRPATRGAPPPTSAGDAQRAATGANGTRPTGSNTAATKAKPRRNQHHTPGEPPARRSPEETDTRKQGHQPASNTHQPEHQTPGQHTQQG